MSRLLMELCRRSDGLLGVITTSPVERVWIQRARRAAIAIAFTAVGLLSAGCDAKDASLALDATTIDAKPWSLSAKQGSWVVVAFQAEWCAPCRQEVRELRAFQKSHPEASIVTVGFMETTAQSARFVKTAGVTWPTIADPNGRVSSAWNVTSLPATVVVAPDGTVAKRFIGSLTAGRLTKEVEKAS